MRTRTFRTLGLLAALCAACVLCVHRASAQNADGEAAKAQLTITCGLSRPAGSISPLAGRTFVLLKQSFNEYLTQHHLFQGPPGTVANVTPLAAWAYAARTGASIAPQTLLEARSLIVAIAKLDTAGSGALGPVPPGTYYLFGQGVSERTQMVWDAKVELREGKNEIVLDSTNTARIDGENPAPKRPVATAMPPIPAATGPRRPSGPSVCTLNVRAVNDSHRPVRRTAFYLLDDNFESILKRAGYKPQMLLGKEQPLLNSFEIQSRWMAMEGSNPVFGLAKSLLGEPAIPAEIKEQYNLARKALKEHTIAIILTGSDGAGSSPRVPAGNYYLYGVANQYVKDGYTGTVNGSTVTLNEQGHQAATIWNVKVALRSGRNVVALSPDNAIFTGN